MTISTPTAAEAARRAGEQLDDILAELRNESRWRQIHGPAWQNLRTGLHVETRYTYGECRVVVTDPSRPRADREIADIKMLGRDEAAISEFARLFPVS